MKEQEKYNALEFDEKESSLGAGIGLDHHLLQHMHHYHHFAFNISIH